MENRRKPAPPATTLDINCDCKEYVIDYLAKSFPVRLMAVFTDENEIMLPVMAFSCDQLGRQCCSLL